LVGLESNNGVRSFLGVRYAKRPTGWTAPPVAVHSRGTVNATALRPSCAQQIATTSPEPEDCLFLNVYAGPPADQTSLNLKATVVWVHGGANSSEYDGPLLAQNNVIAVSVNTRASAAGLLALRWVVDNVLQFGGNGTDVTVVVRMIGG
ncbi:alpha/beta-hydrolase, partial [Auriscalpium vulgare]